ncbi:MAG: HAMP domain-containing sensor histidine kinase, partial [Syntrophaceae bacterium]|nr:HAMP domain-containing sensor histidine kinase [Syntrophaceae bacterium]
KPVISSHELVFNSVEPFQRKALDLGITLNVQLMDDLPSVYADSVLISQVFANLLSNSLKYTTPGGSITISAEYDESFVNFHISDTGKGIPEQYLQKIMQQFFRVPGQSGVTGIGLGLSIVQEIVSAHGGTISVESVEGSGSKFSFSLVRSKEYPGLGVKPWTI